eukprot:COSAG04_NODE_3878_length_2454_cov_2.797452_4_plen_52_part_01
MLRQPWQSAANLQDFRRLVNITDLAVYLLRGILMSTWGVWPAVFRPLRTVFP